MITTPPPLPVTINDSDEKASIWIHEDMLGTVQTLRHRGQEVRYRLPQQVDGQVTLRFKGHGRTDEQQTGDLLLCVRLDRSRNIDAVLWLAESEAAGGCQKILQFGRECLSVTVPPGSRDGQVVRAGRKTAFKQGLPLSGRNRGDLYAKLRVFPETIKPVYGAVEGMSIEELAIEGWVYRRIDLVLGKINSEAFRVPPMTAKEAATLFNERGWLVLARAVVARLGLGTAAIEITSSANLPVPGQCRRSVQKNSWGRILSCRYAISIRSDFLDDPFAVVAILAHELCHVINFRCLAPCQDYVSQPGSELLEEERTVDLLVFMFQLGEFQMRVARKRGMTLGYFNQPLFERIHVILDRKRQAWQTVPRPCGHG